MANNKLNIRFTEISVALFYFVATAASVAGDVLIRPLLAGENYLVQVAGNPGTMVSAVMLFFAASLSIVAIPIMMFPILRRYQETAAIWYLILRLLEATLFVFGALFTLSLVSLSTDRAENEGFSEIGLALRAIADGAYTSGTMIFFGLSAVVIGFVFWKTKLIPVWLSWWKIVGAVLLIGQGGLVLFDAATPTLESVLFIPIAVNEMVLAIRLLAKGFDDAALGRLGLTR